MIVKKNLIDNNFLLLTNNLLEVHISASITQYF